MSFAKHASPVSVGICATSTLASLSRPSLKEEDEIAGNVPIPHFGPTWSVSHRLSALAPTMREGV
jgi:hypothetical protein